jgi:hypothetical protein
MTTRKPEMGLKAAQRKAKNILYGKAASKPKINGEEVLETMFKLFLHLHDNLMEIVDDTTLEQEEMLKRADLYSGPVYHLAKDLEPYFEDAKTLWPMNACLIDKIGKFIEFVEDKSMDRKNHDQA